MPRTSPARFVHVVYRTRRYDEMIAWYQTVFDAKLRHHNPVISFMSYDEEHHRIAFLNLSAVDPNGKEPEQRGKQGVDHVAYTYETLHDLFENYAYLKERGILPYWCIHHGITMSMYYADPDGNQMELQVDCCPTAEEANAFIEGPQFAVNPIGVEYNPDEVLARLRAGTPESEFMKRVVDMPISPIRGSMAA